MNLISFAIKNIGRNRSRTIITVAAMAFAGAIMIFYTSLLHGLMIAMEKNVVQLRLGDVQIHGRGYRDDPDLYTTVKNSGEIVAKLEQAGFHATQRLYGFGLAAAGGTSAGAMIWGVDVEREQSVTNLHTHVMKGRWVDAADPQGVVIGRKLAKTLNVELGDEIVLLSQATDGSMANDILIIRGVMKSVDSQLDGGGILMTQAAFRSFFAMPEDAHEISILRKNVEESLPLAQARIASIARGMEVKSWRDLSPVIAEMLGMFDVSMFFMLMIAYTAIGIVTLNATLMSVFERIREFGVMKAIGVSPWQIAALIFLESGIQGAMACLLAMAGGIPLSLYFQKHGIDLTSLTSASLGTISGVAFDPVWYCSLDAHSVIVPLATLSLVSFIAAIYPGVKAAVIKPVSAIHHI